MAGARILSDFLPDVVVVKGIAAFRAELGGMLGILGLPAALVAAVERLAGGLLGAAFHAELTLVHSAAACAGPAFRLGGLGSAAFDAEFAGVFRAGGDSRFGFICDTIDMWGYAVPLGFLAAAVLKLPPLWVYFLLCTDEFVKWPWVIGHYRSRKWLRNITRDDVLDE